MRRKYTERRTSYYAEHKVVSDLAGRFALVIIVNVCDLVSVGGAVENVRIKSVNKTFAIC